MAIGSFYAYSATRRPNNRKDFAPLGRVIGQPLLSPSLSLSILFYRVIASTFRATQGETEIFTDRNDSTRRDADSRFVRRLFRLLFRLFFFYVVVTWTRDNRRPREPTSVDPTFYFHLARKLPIGSREVGLKISSLKCF